MDNREIATASLPPQALRCQLPQRWSQEYRAYTYFFTPESSVPLMKSAHTSEISTVFNHPEETFMTGRQYDETFGKILRRMWIQFAKTGNPSLTAAESPDGRAHEWPQYDPADRQVMILDEFNIHPEKEAERQIVDWDRTYFLTENYST